MAREALAAALGARVWTNALVSAPSARSFDMHFDAYDELLGQVAGMKEWTISRVRVELPLDAGALPVDTVAGATDSLRPEAEGETLMTITTGPGDVLLDT